MSSAVTTNHMVEADGTMAVYLIADPDTTSPVEADEIAFHAEGVVVVESGIRRFIPYSNISQVKQSV